MTNNVAKVNYDQSEQVIFLDYTDVTMSKAVLEQVLAEVTRITSGLPEKPFIISCLQNAKIDPNESEEYGKLTVQLFDLVQGVIRYGVNDMFTNVTIRSTTVRNRLQHIQSHIYGTREEALQAVHEIRQHTS